MKNFLLSIFLFILISCDSDVNQPVHDYTHIEIFACNWIVQLDAFGYPQEYKCWSVKPVYLEEYNLTPQIAKQIIITIDPDMDTFEVLVENTQGLEINYVISDTSKVAYEKMFKDNIPKMK
ncbi:MAG: hypothetical protein JXR69_08295 [Candidatus Delongbacteria bacterium]|nr:hypothetical protein [Candidatus Delongbacteria bacterium]